MASLSIVPVCVRRFGATRTLCQAKPQVRVDSSYSSAPGSRTAARLNDALRAPVHEEVAVKSQRMSRRESPTFRNGPNLSARGHQLCAHGSDGAEVLVWREEFLFCL
jgi:hypothetical protein